MPQHWKALHSTYMYIKMTTLENLINTKTQKNEPTNISRGFNDVFSRKATGFTGGQIYLN